MKLIATKPLLYGTRRLLPGDAFDAPQHHARVLLAVKKVRDPSRRAPVRLASPRPDLVARLTQAATAAPEEHSEPEPAVVPLGTAAGDAGDATSDDGEPVETGPDIEALRSEAQTLGIAVDRRWGERRIREAMAAARDAARE